VRILLVPALCFCSTQTRFDGRGSDHTQDFFARFLGHKYFDTADPQRGGGVAPLPFEVSTGEEMYTREPSHGESPERVYERRWTRTLLDSVEMRLRADAPVEFGRLKGLLQGDGDTPYADLARDLRISEGALKVRVHRMRKLYGELIRREVAEIVNDPNDIDAELRYLITALALGA
jgi:hypothetical protein